MVLEGLANYDCGYFFETSQSNYPKIPGSPIAFSSDQNLINVFNDYPNLKTMSDVKQGLITGNTNKFLRLKIGLAKETEIDTISYVLGKLTKKEIDQINKDTPHYFDIINTFIKYDVNKVMMM